MKRILTKSQAVAILVAVNEKAQYEDLTGYMFHNHDKNHKYYKYSNEELKNMIVNKTPLDDDDITDIVDDPENVVSSSNRNKM